MGPGRWHSNTPTWCTRDKSLLDQKWLIDIFNRFGLFADTDSQCRKSDWPAIELLTQRRQNRTIYFVKAAVIDAKDCETFIGNSARDLAIAANFGEISDSTK